MGKPKESAASEKKNERAFALAGKRAKQRQHIIRSLKKAAKSHARQEAGKDERKCYVDLMALEAWKKSGESLSVFDKYTAKIPAALMEPKPKTAKTAAA